MNHYKLVQKPVVEQPLLAQVNLEEPGLLKNSKFILYKNMKLPENQARSDIMKEISDMRDKIEDVGLEFQDDLGEMNMEIDELQTLLEENEVEMPELVKPEKKESKIVNIDFEKVKLSNEKVGEKFDALSKDISEQTFDVFGTLTGVNGNEWEEKAYKIIGKNSNHPEKVKLSCKTRTLAQVGELPTLSLENNQDLNDLLESKFKQ